MKPPMMSMNKRLGQKVLAAALLLLVATPMAFAETVYRREYNSRTGQYVFVPVSGTRQNLRNDVDRAWRNPVVKQAAVGAAVGAVGGALSDKSSVLRGAAIGGLVGTGTGLIDRSQTLQNRPLVRTALKGAAIGTGAGAITRRSAVKGAVVGAAAGTGWHFINNYLQGERLDGDRRW